MTTSYKHPICRDRKLASKRGIIVTGVILATITGASFIFWVLPQENTSTFVVTDHKSHLDGVMKIHEVLEESIEIEFQNLVDGKITPEEYVEATETTSSQVTAQITEFVKSKPPEEWQESYINYMEALKKFNAYIIETKVVANMIEEGSGGQEGILQKIEVLKKEYSEMIELSNQSRP